MIFIFQPLRMQFLIEYKLEKENDLIAHCLFEQSGTFKNEFKKLGIEAYDYDILNDYGETDYQMDLFNEIEAGYEGKPSIFDNIKSDDLILAFFPCTRFGTPILLHFRGDVFQMRKYTDIQKLDSDLKLHQELHQNYELITKLAIIVLRKGLRLVFENPYSKQHYLTRYWCLKPAIIDKDRTLNGDYCIKPTQYWFVGFKPQQNILPDPIEYVEKRNIYHMKSKDGKNKTVRRSEIHPQYANRFIRQYLLEED